MGVIWHPAALAQAMSSCQRCSVIWGFAVWLLRTVVLQAGLTTTSSCDLSCGLDHRHDPALQSSAYARERYCCRIVAAVVAAAGYLAARSPDCWR